MNIGFLGCGNIAQAMIVGLLDSALSSKPTIMACAIFPQPKKPIFILFYQKYFRLLLSD